MEKKHLWQGIRITDAELEKRLDHIGQYTVPVLGSPFPLEYCLDLLERLRGRLLARGPEYDRLKQAALLIHGAAETRVEAMLESIISFISRENLTRKLWRELGTMDPFALQRPVMKEEPFEAWQPLGILVHVAPTNVFTVGVLCIIEGLLSGNINILKTSSSQHQVVQLFFQDLLALDSRGLLAPYIIVLEVSSRRHDLLARIIQNADVVSAWGSEEAIDSLRAMTPGGVRFVEWGHKISFAWFARESLADSRAMRRVCEDICLLDQNACSSPQNVFIECDDFAELENFARKFADILARVSQRIPGETPSTAARAEISTVVSIARTEEALGLTRVFQARDRSWAVIADRRSGLAVSPLFRTILIKPLPAGRIIETLHPMKRYLQTVALTAPKERIIPLTRQFFGAGCLRIRLAGHMHDNYTGEPHDGVYALPSFMKRVSLVLGDQMRGIAGCNQFEETWQPELGNTPLMDKKTFQTMEVAPEYADLTFKSGGSSGKTTYSCFTYEDYNIHMQAAARGLFATGLDPTADRAVNMFAAGHLYGGFLSFFTILENLGLPQYPMGLVDELEEVGQLIVEKQINTIFTLPTLVMKLFAANEQLFRHHQVVKKIIFGGDHFPAGQIRHLQETFGVQMVRAIYGSNDAGVLGYQCPECAMGEYHLLSELNMLEVFALDQEQPVEDGTTGRLVFTSRHRKGQKILRYDLGDTGFIHKKPCSCGRRDPKFSLMGRSSDAFKAGGPFLNYTRFNRCLEEQCGYSGLSQILLSSQGNRQQLVLRVEPEIGQEAAAIAALLLRNYEELRLSVEDLGIDFRVELVEKNNFASVPRSGKILHIIDQRGES